MCGRAPVLYDRVVFKDDADNVATSFKAVAEIVGPKSEEQAEEGAGLLALLDKYFLNRTFNGVDLKADTAWLQRLASLD